jgi:adenosine kinase
LRILVTGSIAYDTIMVFPDRFKNHLLADQLHILNVCFLTPEMRREFGGTAGNIGYNLKLLGEQPLVMATVGEDIQPYLERLEELGIGASLLKRIDGQFTAQAFITTDLDDNQITAFHPGAMNHSHTGRIDGAIGASLAIISPDGKDGMIAHARQCAEHGIAFMFDPGQGLPMFAGAEIAEFLRLADYVAVNDYEGKLLEEKSGRSLEELAREVSALVVTLGARGSVIYARDERHEIPCVQAERVLDPTGCGDAYRAGLLYGIAEGWDWPSTGRLGAVMGAIKIAHRGAQNHAPSRAEIEARFQTAFGYSPWKRRASGGARAST